jgi:hypothetical protein
VNSFAYGRGYAARLPGLVARRLRSFPLGSLRYESAGQRGQNNGFGLTAQVVPDGPRPISFIIWIVYRVVGDDFA